MPAHLFTEQPITSVYVKLSLIANIAREGRANEQANIFADLPKRFPRPSEYIHFYLRDANNFMNR